LFLGLRLEALVALNQELATRPDSQFHQVPASNLQGGPQKPFQLDGPDAKLKIALISELRRAAHTAAVSHRLEHLRVGYRVREKGAFNVLKGGAHGGWV